VILSADTVVVLNNRILGKPKNVKDALKMLKKLNNKTHSVLTAYTVLAKNNGKIKIVDEKIVESKVHFGNFSDQDYIDYVKTKEPLDKAGAYAVQGLGARFVKEVKGSYSNVVGLPLFEVMNSLKKAGVKAPWK
jgi:septum formation protein